MDESSAPKAPPPLLYPMPFVVTLAYPALIWTVVVMLATTDGQPGAVCLTPMAWLLALWAGVSYVQRCEGRPGRPPLLGPALLGGTLGLIMGIIFAVVIYLKVPPVTAKDSIQTAALTLVMLVAGTVACAGFSTLMSWLTLRRYARSSE